MPNATRSRYESPEYSGDPVGFLGWILIALVVFILAVLLVIVFVEMYDPSAKDRKPSIQHQIML